MSKLTLLPMALLFAGCATTGGWRDLRIDASSQDRFESSVAGMQDALPYSRSQMLAIALRDIWYTGVESAQAGDGSEYTPEQYLNQVDGLGYADVIDLADASGPTVLRQYTTRRVAQTTAANRGPEFSPPRAQPYVAPGRAPSWASNPWAGVSPWPLNHP